MKIHELQFPYYVLDIPILINLPLQLGPKLEYPDEIRKMSLNKNYCVCLNA